MEDLNQDNQSQEIQNFLVLNGLIDTHQCANNAAKEQHDKTFIRESECTDTIIMVHGMASQSSIANLRIFSYLEFCNFSMLLHSYFRLHSQV